MASSGSSIASTGIALGGTLPAAVRERAPIAPWRWVGTLYFAEGLPATVVASLSAVILKQLGVPNAKIALCVSGFMLPWTLRPLWSPLLELVGTKRLFVVATEAMIAVCLAGTAVALATGAATLMCILLLGLIAFAAATHDMAADGLFIRSLSPETQQRYIGWLGVAFNAAKLTAQGLLVIVVGQITLWRGVLFAWQVGFLILAAITAALAVYHWRCLPDDEPARTRPRSVSAVTSSTFDVVTSFFRNGRVAWLLALIVLYRLAEGQLVRIVPLFLLDAHNDGGLGLSATQLGAFYGGIGGVAFVGGAVIGGWLATRLGEQRALLPLCLAFNLPALFYLLLAGFQPTLSIAAFAIVGEQLAYGIGSIGLKLATLAAARGPYETAHCAFAGALSGVGAIVAGMLSGTLQSNLGYTGFFTVALVASLPPLLVACALAARRS